MQAAGDRLLRALADPLAGPSRAPGPRRGADRAGLDRLRRRVATGRVQAPERPEAGQAGTPATGRSGAQVDWMCLYGAFWHDRFDGLESQLKRMENMSQLPTQPLTEPPTQPITTPAGTRSLVVEREMPHPPEKIWRALTEGSLIEEWLMKNDFQPRVGHRFNFRAEPMPHWNGVTDCEVLTVEPKERLSYSWNASGEEAANGLKTVVTWTLTPAEGGTLVMSPDNTIKFSPEKSILKLKSEMRSN